MKKIKYEKIIAKTRNIANKILKEEWGSTDIIIRGNIIDGTKLNGFFAVDDINNIIGLITYIIYDNNECEIVSLNSNIKNIGIGTNLIKKVKEIALKNKCRVIKLITTNDNINALEFYQKRGFVISNIYLNSITKSRELKPSIPLYAENGIMIRDEIELKINL